MKRITLFASLLLLAIVAVPAFAQLPRTEALLKDLETKHQFYGAVLVKKGGIVVFQSAYGAKEPPYPTPRNTPDVAFYLTECGEIFGGALALMAVDKGLLKLEEPIGTYIPAFKGKPAPRVRDLLDHSSGLVHRMVHTGDKPRTKADTAAWAAEDGLAFPPGSRSVFSHADFDVLGYALELASGKPYKQLLAEWIVAPLGLKQTGLGLFPEGNPALAQIPRMNDFNSWMKLIPDGSLPSDMYSNAEELGVFLEALASGRLLPRPAFDALRTGLLPEVRFTKGKGKVGLGAYLTPGGAVFNQGALGGTSSDTGGYHALALHDPRYGLTLVLLANKWKPNPEGDALGLVAPAVYADLGLAE
jgi:CubicO group peptidase (beta-lactamase class C family)